MVKHTLTPENVKMYDAAIDQIAIAANGTAFPDGFLMSARKAYPSGAAAHQAAQSAAGQEAQKNAAIEAVKAGAPAASGNSASKTDAIIFLLGHKAAAKAGKTGWQAYVEGAAQSRKLGGKLGQKSAAIEAVKAGAPAESGGASKQSTMMWTFSGGSKSSSSTWAEREATATVALIKGRALGAKNSAAARAIESFVHPIATHLHECMDPECRHPVKLKSHYKKG